MASRLYLGKRSHRHGVVASRAVSVPREVNCMANLSSSPCSTVLLFLIITNYRVCLFVDWRAVLLFADDTLIWHWCREVPALMQQLLMPVRTLRGADLWLMRIRSFETRRKHNVALRVSHCQVEEDEDISQQSFKILYRYRIGRWRKKLSWWERPCEVCKRFRVTFLIRYLKVRFKKNCLSCSFPQYPLVYGVML